MIFMFVALRDFKTFPVFPASYLVCVGRYPSAPLFFSGSASYVFQKRTKLKFLDEKSVWDCVTVGVLIPFSEFERLQRRVLSLRRAVFFILVFHPLPGKPTESPQCSTT